MGAGNRGGDVYAAWVARHPDRARITAVADPRPERRARIVAAHGARPFADWAELIGAVDDADGAIVATPDDLHVQPALAAAGRGWPVLLEKPVAREPAALQRLVEGIGDHPVTVAHVLRYTPFFQRLKTLLGEGAIGRLVSVRHAEHIAWWHFAHSYVRGNWRQRDTSGPLILTKACHDLDLLCWLVDDAPVAVSASGGLTWFRAETAPAGATARCTDGCPAEPSCPWSARRIYLERFAHTGGWPVSVLTEDASPAGRERALREGPYGRCVHRCDNDVEDHVAAQIRFAGGVVASLTVSAFTAEHTRTIALHGTHGELTGHLERGEIALHDFTSGTTTRHDVGAAPGHAGGDDGLMDDFVRRLSDGGAAAPTSLRASLDSHALAFAVDVAMRTRQMVTL